LENPYEFDFDLKKVSAITVNTTHGCKKSIDLFKNKFNADIETMEGAAFFYVCLNEGVKFFQIRTISNFVEERNEANWNIPLAIKNLNQQLSGIIDVIVKNEKS
jgi:futalosine hydrolase